MRSQVEEFLAQNQRNSRNAIESVRFLAINGLTARYRVAAHRLTTYMPPDTI
jgi:hypothetical protein